MQQKLLRQLSGHTRDNTPLQTLSRREQEVFQFLAQGFNSEEIAQKLFISLKTVQTHQGNIKRKLDQPNIRALRRLAKETSTTPVQTASD